MEPLRVLELLVSTDLGGGPAHVHALAAGLPRPEFDLTIAGPAGGPYEKAFRDLGVDFVGIRADRLSPAALLRVIRLVRQRGIEIIHSHGKGAGLYGRLAARLTGVAAIHTFHGVHHERYPRLYLDVERWLTRWSDAVIHVSESQAAAAAALGLAPGKRSRVIVNGVDTARVRAMAEGAPLSRGALGLEADTLVLGTVARFDPVKGLDVLLRAFATLLERVPAAQLLLVGDGSETPRLRGLVHDLGVGSRVVFTGFIPDAARCLPVMDLYVSASWREGLPLAALEAMAGGLPIVATRVPGHVDVVEDGVTGVLVPPGDSDRIAHEAARLLQDPVRRRALGEAGRQRVEGRFALARMLDEVAALYREIGSFRRPRV